MGDFHVGLRSDDARMLARLAAIYRDDVVHDEAAFQDFGVVLGSQTARTRPVPFVARGCRPVLRSRVEDRLVHNLDARLRALRRSTPGHVRLDGMSAVMAGRSAVLLDTSLVKGGSAFERELLERGLTIADAPAASLSVGAESVLVDGPMGRIDEPSGKAERLLAAPGAYQLVDVIWDGRKVSDGESRARAVVRMFSRLERLRKADGELFLRSIAQRADTIAGQVLDIRRHDLMERVSAAMVHT